MTVYTRAQAVARALKSRTYPQGMCYRWTREQFGLPSVGDRDGDGDADAVDGWRAADRRHHGDVHPPAGVPVFWSGGSKGHGHAAISLGNGRVRSIDAAGFGNVGTVDLGWFGSAWGLTYLGWSEDLGGTVIPNPPPPPGVTAPPVRIYAANLDFTTGAADDRRHLALLLDAAPHAALVGVQEAKNILLANVVKGLGAVGFQRVRNASVRGSGFVARGIKGPRNFRLFLGARSVATLPRWIARMRFTIGTGRDTGDVVVFSAHPPPKRAGRAAQDRHLANLAKRTVQVHRAGLAWVVCIDANRDLEAVAELLGGTAYGAPGDRIVGVIVSPRVTVSASGVARGGRAQRLTDHLAPWVDVTHVHNTKEHK